MGVWTSIKEFFTVESPEVRRERLERLAAIVDQHVATWPEVGAALREIRESQLYRDAASTFEDYCRQRWNMSDRQARYLIDAAELVGKLGTTVPKPQTPRLVRPIATLPEEDQVEAWEDAVSLAAGDPVRPEHVAAAVAKRKPTSKSKKPPKPIRIRVPGAIVTIEPGKAFTSAAEALRFALRQVEQSKAA